MSEPKNIPETTWAYLAGMIDGEGHMALFRHYKPNSKSGVSKRGYEIETKLTIASMNKETLDSIQKLIGLGHISSMWIKRKDEEHPYENHDIRYKVSDQRIILPKVLPYLIHKKDIATIVLKLLDYRLNKKDKEFTEKFYLELEEEYRCAIMKAKPWLLTIIARGGKVKQRNLNLIKGYNEHTYIRNYEPSRHGKSGASPNEPSSNR